MRPGDPISCPACGTVIPDGAPYGMCPKCLLAGWAAGNDMEVEDGVSGDMVNGDSPEMIGPYRLIGPLGEGGMGKVFVAEQLRPIRRRVALKVIKPGMDSREVIARFEAERQAVALMDHPGIARVYDAGTTEGGHPYFVMELVSGTPLTKFCDARKLGLPERLALFQQICHAVQHAHQKGVIHRDLKPSNILVAVDDDGMPVPKIIDFGVAKALGPGLTGQTLFTVAGQLIGTPQYMSPEQAAFDATDIDTRSDIYALGVLLYELLTGSTPLDAAELQHAGLDAMLRTIREQDAPKPSTRLGSLKEETRTSISEARQLQPSKLTHTLRGDLDWVVMKALEKERDRRYESASAFSQDIRRYLEDEPVSASPPSAAYRFKKFARRNKGFIATASVVLAVLIGGIVATTWQAREARLQRDHANQTRAAAEGLVAVMLDDINEKLSAIGRLDLMDDISNAGEDYFDSLPEDQTNDRTSYLRARALLKRASVLHSKGDNTDEVKHALDALALARKLVVSDPDSEDYLALLSNCYSRLIGEGLVDSSVEMAEENLALGERLMARGQLRATDYWIAAEAWLDSINVKGGVLARAGKALAIADKGNAAHPDNRNILSCKANSHYLIGRYEPELEDQVDAMEEAITSARAILRLSGPDHAVWRKELASYLQQSSWLSYTLGNRLDDPALVKRAIDRQAEALDELEGLFLLSPEDVTLRSQLAIAHHNYGKHLLLAGDQEKALDHWDQCISHQEYVSRRDTGNTGAVSDCLHEVQLMARHLKDRGPEANEDALGFYQRVMAMVNQLPETLRVEIESSNGYIKCLDYLVEIQSNTGKELLNLSVELPQAQQTLETQIRESASTQYITVKCELHWLICKRLALAELTAGHRAAGLDWIRKAKEVVDGHSEIDPEDKTFAKIKLEIGKLQKHLSEP